MKIGASCLLSNQGLLGEAFNLGGRFNNLQVAQEGGKILTLKGEEVVELILPSKEVVPKGWSGEVGALLEVVEVRVGEPALTHFAGAAFLVRIGFFFTTMVEGREVSAEEALAAFC
ncbi:hypothetical protein ACFE04_011542 [Oxalis oulophora]